MEKPHTDQNNKKQLEEELDEVFLRHMMQDYMQHRGDQLLAEEASLPDTEDSKPTAKQLKRLTRKLKKAARRSGYQVRRIPRKAMPLVVTLVALLAISLITASAYRFKLFNFLNVPGTVATEYGAQDVGEREYEFVYIPDGFSERFYKAEDDGIRAYFVDVDDKNRYFQVYITENSKRISPDTENATPAETVQVHGLSGNKSMKDGLLSIAWVDRSAGITYLVQSTLDEDEVIKIAEGINKK